VSLGVGLAAATLKIPLLIHESDNTLGLTHSALSKFAKEILFSSNSALENNKKFKNGFVTGIPINKSIVFKGDDKYKMHFKFDGKRPVLLIMGGSLGATAINEVIWKALRDITDKYNVIHVCGEGKMPRIEVIKEYSGKYFACEFLKEELAEAYYLAEVIITRGGANSLSEIEFLNKKAIVVPLSRSVSRGDQIENAEEFLKNNIGMKIEEEEFDADRLIKGIEAMIKIENKPNKSIRNSNEIIAKKIFSFENRV